MNTGNLSRRSALGTVAAALIAPTVSEAAQTPGIRVHKDLRCGCCSGRVRHLEAAGFGVAVQEERNFRTPESAWASRPISSDAIRPRRAGS